MGWVGGVLAQRRGDVRDGTGRELEGGCPGIGCLGETSTHTSFFLWLESKDDLHLKHHFAITTLTRARPAPGRPTLCFSFPPLLCTHSCLSVSSKKKNMFWLGWKGEIFFYYYIYISSFKLLLEVRLDLPKQVCSARPQRLPSVSPLGSQGSLLRKLGGARFPDGGPKPQRVAMLRSL